MRTVYKVNVIETDGPWDPEGRAVGLHRSVNEYRDEVDDIAYRLSLVKHAGSLPRDVLKAIAHEIVSQDVPENHTREALRQEVEPIELKLGRTSMLALDGGYHAMWAAARTD